MNNSIKFTALGQVGYIIDVAGKRIVIDPYLSDYVETIYGEDFKRISPLPIQSKELERIDYLLISHEHEDHCDPISLREIYDTNHNVEVICPKPCNSIIEEIPFKKVWNPKVSEVVKIGEVSVHCIPSCHPEIEMEGDFSRYLGFIISISGFVIYHPGDTMPFADAKKYLPEKINFAFLPINERNYFRDAEGVIGNMTCREALLWSKELNIEHWIPTHWDTFAGNCTYREELDILSSKMNIRNYSWLDAGESIEITY